MKHIKKLAIIFPTVAISLLTLSGSASALDYTIQIKNSLTGDDISNHQFEFELRDAVTNRLLQTKISNEEAITFDPIQADFSRAQAPIDFYKVIEKDLGEDGMTYDEQVAYIGLHGDGKVAYQKDNTYKYISKDGQPHPFHATEDELQGEAYAEVDLESGKMVFFRDEPDKYVCERVPVKNSYGNTYMEMACDVVGNKFYLAGFEKDTNKEHGDLMSGSFGIYSKDGTSQYRLGRIVKEVTFRDAIRPEGEMENWFYYYDVLEKADISKLDTSRATKLTHMFAYDKKLYDVDITKLDFSNLEGSGSLWASFEYGNFREFDSRHYDFSKTAGAYATGEFFTAYSAAEGLRYANIEKMVSKGSSADFSGNGCLEKLVLGKTYTLYNGGSNLGLSKWLNIDTGTIVDESPTFHEYQPDRMAAAAGTYVRPICNVDPVTFENSYTKPEPNAKLVFRFVDQYGRAMMKTVAKSGYVGEQSDYRPPEIPGYRLIIDEDVDYTFTKAEKVITFHYEKIENPNTAVSTPVIYFVIFGALAAGVGLVGHRIAQSAKQ